MWTTNAMMTAPIVNASRCLGRTIASTRKIAPSAMITVRETVTIIPKRMSAEQPAQISRFPPFASNMSCTGNGKSIASIDPNAIGCGADPAARTPPRSARSCNSPEGSRIGMNSLRCLNTLYWVRRSTTANPAITHPVKTSV